MKSVTQDTFINNISIKYMTQLSNNIDKYATPLQQKNFLLFLGMSIVGEFPSFAKAIRYASQKYNNAGLALYAPNGYIYHTKTRVKYTPN